MSRTSARVSAYYSDSVAAFQTASVDAVVGALTRTSAGNVDHTQVHAWEVEARVLREALANVSGHLFLEFSVPRLGSRVDAVLVSGPAVMPIEFKVGQDRYDRAHVDQAWDYGLDLKNFHEASHTAPIFPLLVAVDAPRGDASWRDPHPDGVRPPRRTNAAGVGPAIAEALALAVGPPIDPLAWGAAPYHPTPTIVQAARALYARHSVDSISRHDAGARNLTETSGSVEEIIAAAAATGKKAIVFVTGVPGAGKTLVGLNIATRHRKEETATHSVFLSGNGPLVAVLREALIRDELGRSKAAGEVSRKGDVAQRVKPFIQNVHHFRDDGVRDRVRAPHDHVVIFDEAQRAWDRQQTSNFMRRRKGLPAFDQSEPEFLIGYLDRHSDWAVIVCLVGGGQEIHTGEAGIGAWLEAIDRRFSHWEVHLSPNLRDSEYSAATSIEQLSRRATVHQRPQLHLSTSLRSFRSESASAFVKALLDGAQSEAEGLLARDLARYPIVLTRSLAAAKSWLRSNARGTERFGVVTSSQAERLKPYAIDVRVAVDPVKWFLNEANDTRSSYYLEDAATEFQVQGLELDWTCVAWDADLRRTGQGWSYHRFRGTGWVHVRQEDRRRFMMNAYRVLLTRGRQGMVVFVPRGDTGDPTRHPTFYDETYRYLRSVGLRELDQEGEVTS
ncbi:MAG: DUF2075 domain-containing protein [Gemmatimonadetes bacterium]|nr:DUF2075 domain-containing protein [Gemmatimonadota bacterium]